MLIYHVNFDVDPIGVVWEELLTHLNQMDLSILISRTSSFPILGVLCVVFLRVFVLLFFFNFYIEHFVGKQ